MTRRRKIVAALMAGASLALMGSGLTLAFVGRGDAGLWIAQGALLLILLSRIVRKGRLE